MEKLSAGPMSCAELAESMQIARGGTLFRNLDELGKAGFKSHPREYTVVLCNCPPRPGGAIILAPLYGQGFGQYCDRKVSS